MRPRAVVIKRVKEDIVKGPTITLLVTSVLSIAPAVQSQGRKSLKLSFELC